MKHPRQDRLRAALPSIALLTITTSAGCPRSSGSESCADAGADASDATVAEIASHSPTVPALYGSCIPDVLETQGCAVQCPPPIYDGSVATGVACNAAPDAGRCTFDHYADASYRECYCTPLCNGAGAQWLCGRWAIGPLPPPELVSPG